MDIQVGDRVTYIDKQGKKCIIMVLEDKGELSDCEDNSISEILKIERPKYEEVEEKKELLTAEEKEFLKQYIKILESLNNGEVISARKQSSWLILKLATGLEYQAEVGVKYKTMKDCQKYTLKELGLEGD